MVRKLSEFYGDQYTSKLGSDEYSIDLPDGDHQVEYDLRADDIIRVYLGCGNQTIPLGVGHHVRGIIRVRDAKALLIRCGKKTLVCCQVYTEECNMAAKLDMTPLEVAVLDEPPLDVKQMAMRLVAQALEERSGTRRRQAESDDVMENLPDDVDEEFGPGFMDMDEDGTEDLLRRMRHPNRRVRRDADSDAGPDKDRDREPGPPGDEGAPGRGESHGKPPRQPDRGGPPKVGEPE